MPTVGTPGQPGYKEFPYTAAGQAKAQAYADQTGLTLHEEKAAAGGPSKQRRPSPPARRPASKINIPTPSTKQY